MGAQTQYGGCVRVATVCVQGCWHLTQLQLLHGPVACGRAAAGSAATAALSSGHHRGAGCIDASADSSHGAYKPTPNAELPKSPPWDCCAPKAGVLDVPKAGCARMTATDKQPNARGVECTDDGAQGRCRRWQAESVFGQGAVGFLRR